jgi:RNA polymerase sigma-70 factor, ECF subfamily
MVGAGERGSPAARVDDEVVFSELFDRHRREVHVHCHRMLGSVEDAEDLTQEAFLRAWRKRETFEGRSSFRSWMYRIATNACLDALHRRPRYHAYPDELLEGLRAPDAEPEAAVISKETIEQAFLAPSGHLPHTQRAVLFMRGVLGWSAKDTAAVLDRSVASVNSALQRARATVITSGSGEREPGA